MNMTQPLDIQSLFDGQPFSSFQRRIFALCFAIVLLDGFDTAAIGFIAPSLIKEWGISKPALAPVLSAALFGLAGGALVAGPLADRIGRKLVLTVSVFLFGVASLASAWVANIDELALLRAITGIGLGAALPNAVTLMNEYCPSARRAIVTNALLCGFPVGAALGGFLASWLIPHWGFHSVFVFGGVVPLVLTALVAWGLPESLRYLAMRPAAEPQLRSIWRRVAPHAQIPETFMLATPGASAKVGIRVLMTSSYVTGSLMLWIAYFMGLVIFYSVINWLPVLLREAGLAPQAATLISALFPLGGVGAVYAGWLMDRFNANRIVAAFYGLTAVSLVLLGKAGTNIGMLIVVVSIAGIVMNTAQSSLPSLAAAFYPTEGRATGVAWMMGIGRFGGILGSYLVAELTRRQLPLEQIFIVLAVPGVIAGAAILIKQMAVPDKAAEHGLIEEAVPHS